MDIDYVYLQYLGSDFVIHIVNLATRYSFVSVVDSLDMDDSIQEFWSNLYYTVLGP